MANTHKHTAPIGAEESCCFCCLCRALAPPRADDSNSDTNLLYSVSISFASAFHYLLIVAAAAAARNKGTDGQPMPLSAAANKAINASARARVNIVVD